MSLLDDARKRINEVDAQMADLFEQRMQAVEDVIRYKVEHQMDVLDTGREKDVLKRNMGLIKQDKYKDSYLAFMEDMLKISKDYQKSVIYHDTVGYQGVQGAFSHIASEKVFPYRKKRNFASFEDVFQAVCQNEIAYGVIPLKIHLLERLGKCWIFYFVMMCISNRSMI